MAHPERVIPGVLRVGYRRRVRRIALLVIVVSTGCALWRPPALAVLLVLVFLAPVLALAGAGPLRPGALAALILRLRAPVLALVSCAACARYRADRRFRYAMHRPADG